MSIVFILAIIGTNFSDGKRQGFDNVVVRGDNGIVFERMRVDDVNKMASLKEEEIVAPPSSLSDEFINDVNSRAFVWEVSDSCAYLSNLDDCRG